MTGRLTGARGLILGSLCVGQAVVVMQGAHTWRPTYYCACVRVFGRAVVDCCRFPFDGRCWSGLLTKHTRRPQGAWSCCSSHTAGGAGVLRCMPFLHPIANQTPSLACCASSCASTLFSFKTGHRVSSLSVANRRRLKGSCFCFVRRGGIAASECDNCLHVVWWASGGHWALSPRSPAFLLCAWR